MERQARSNKVLTKIRHMTGRPFRSRWNRKFQRVAGAHREDRDTLVIYQMGKVGSSSVKKTLAALGVDMNIYHVHALTHERIATLIGVYKRAARIRCRADVHSHIVESAFLRQRLDRGRGERWKVISLVRDPVARNISSFFQSFDQFNPEFVAEFREHGRFREDSIDKLIGVFFDRFDHDMPLRWFDAYMAPVFQIDVFATPFPQDLGYEIYSGPDADLLLMRLEDMASCAGEAFREFLGIEDFVLQDANKTEDKADSQAYREFKQRIEIPDAYLEKMYSSKFARHFYSETEIERFRRKWST